MRRKAHGSVAARAKRVPESTEELTADQRLRIAQAIRSSLPHLKHLVAMLEIGLDCPDPESCLSTADTLRRTSARLGGTVRGLLSS